MTNISRLKIHAFLIVNYILGVGIQFRFLSQHLLKVLLLIKMRRFINEMQFQP
jgi:hypothetical protein